MNTNVAVLSGRLARDPEMRYTQGGKAVTKFTLAVNRGGRAENGEKSEADFIPVVVWDKQAEACAQYLAKGSQALVSGRISTRNYDAQDGTKRFVTEIVANRVEFIGGSTQKAQSAPGDAYPAPAGYGAPARPAAPAARPATPTRQAAPPAREPGEEYFTEDDFPL